MGLVYINPQSGERNADEITNMFDALLEEVAIAQRTFTHVLMAGDFNAHVGVGDEFVHEHFDLMARFPCLNAPRLTGCGNQSNLAGRLLLDVASAGPLILTTGRGRGDQGQGV